jgi:GT2 family glycosyltransferase
VFVVCGVFNGLAHTREMMAAVSRQTWQPISTILIDDGSNDGTEKWFRENYPQEELLRGDGNLWWTGALRLGVARALAHATPGDFVLTMNNDCVFEPEYVRTLVETSHAHGRIIVGSTALDQSDRKTLIGAGVRIDWRRGLIEHSRLPPLGELNALEGDDTADTVSTKGTLFPVEVFQRIGNFDASHLPHYLSDYEFGCRALRSGFPILVSYRARVYNDGERTGFGEPEKPSRLPVRQVLELLFGRKSKSNIVDHWWFITLCCPGEYKARNYARLVWRALRIVSFALPLRTALKSMKNRIG